MSLTKSDIISKVSEEIGLTTKKSIEIIDNFIDIIKSTLESGDDVLVSGFGKFSVNNKNQRRGRNPATGSDMILPSRRVVTFKCSGKLRDRINRIDMA